MPEHFKEIFGALSKLPSREEFVAAFKTAMDTISLALIDINKRVDARLARIKDGRDGAAGPKGDKGDKGDRGPQGRTFIALRGEQGDAGIPGKDGSSDTPEQVRDKLETLHDDDRLDASAIKNLPEATVTHQHNHAPVTALWALADMALSGITAGQSLQWDGIKWIPYSPAGSGGTPVWGEDLTVQGAGTIFTLAHTPIVGTVRLFRGGAYQSAQNGDYSITGDTITLSPALAQGEILVADYSYT